MKHTKLWAFLSLFILSFTVANFSPVVQQTLAANPTAGTWIDSGYIDIGGTLWVDRGPLDTDHNYKAPSHGQKNNGEPCEDSLTVEGYIYETTGTEAKIQNYKLESGSCKKDGAEYKITLSAADKRRINAYRIDAQTIFMPRYYGYEGNASFYSSNATQYEKGIFKIAYQNNNDLYSLVNADGSQQDPQGTSSKIYLTQNKEVAFVCGGGAASFTGCNDVSTATIHLSNQPPPAIPYGQISASANSSANTVTGGSTTPSSAGGDSSANANPSIQCENRLGSTLDSIRHPIASIGKGINWLVCAIIRGVNDAINYFDGIIINELQFSSSDLEAAAADGTSNGYYEAWSAFRYIAVGLLVLIGLVMVISQLIGIGIFDAYTVKKLLPRIFAAAILITVSWSLCKIVIDIFNVIGGATRSLIYAPFGGVAGIQNKLNTAIAGATTKTNITAGAGVLIGGYFLLATTNFMVILAFAVPVLFAVFLGLFFVVMREVAIILCVILAPLAIVAYIMPGTEKVWKLWRERLYAAY